MSSTTGIISGAIKWTGLASGTDFGSVVDQLVAIEQRTITRQEAWKAEWEEKITAINGLNTRLVTLKLDAQDKDIRSELLSRTAAISNEGVVSVVNTSTAPLGSFDLTVADSTVEKFASRSYDKDGTIELDPSAVVGSSTITITVGDPANGGHTYTLIDVGYSGAAVAGTFRTGAGSSLQTLVEDINATVAASGFDLVTASILDDAVRNGVDCQRLQLTSVNPGSANHITVDDTVTTLALGSKYVADPTYTTFKGSDAVISVDRSSEYTGNVNKTFTFVALNAGILGQDDITFQWADTEGNSGKFTVTAVDEEVTVFQGLKVKFEQGVTGRFIANESFSIDCQAPTMQKGQDTGVAQTAKLVHSGFADQISPIHSGTATVFTYNYRGVDFSVNVTDGMSLNLLAEAINNASDNIGVTASVVNDGTGTSTAYHLILTGAHTGAESEIRIVAGTFNTADFTAASFSTAREATNAMVKVDGFPAGADTWLQRRTNEISDVVEGVVMTIKGPGTSSVTIVNDASAMRDKIVQLVESVNFCKSYILEFTKWGESNLEVTVDESSGMINTSRETANGIMIGNYGFQITKSYLDSLMSTSIVPFSADPTLSTKERIEKRQAYLDANGLLYTSLSQIGITLDAEEGAGQYKVDQSFLLDCINTNPEAVIKLFTFTDEYADKDASGKDIMVSISGFSVAMGNKMAELTSDTDVYDTAGNFVEKGKGILVTLAENYQDIIKGINAKIEREERRIDAYKQRLTDKFNRLEVALQTLESQQSSLEASLESLKNSNNSSK
jgi:flagellar hook-associated protein 2